MSKLAKIAETDESRSLHRRRLFRFFFFRTGSLECNVTFQIYFLTVVSFFFIGLPAWKPPQCSLMNPRQICNTFPNCVPAALCKVPGEEKLLQLLWSRNGTTSGKVFLVHISPVTLHWTPLLWTTLHFCNSRLHIYCWSKDILENNTTIAIKP